MQGYWAPVPRLVHVAVFAADGTGGAERDVLGVTRVRGAEVVVVEGAVVAVRAGVVVLTADELDDEVVVEEVVDGVDVGAVVDC